jgi:hypothetical protein
VDLGKQGKRIIGKLDLTGLKTCQVRKSKPVRNSSLTEKLKWRTVKTIPDLQNPSKTRQDLKINFVKKKL